MTENPRAPADSPCETDRSLLRQAMELLGAIGVGKAGAHALHNACNLRNRIDAHLQYHQLDNLRGDSAPPALGRPLDLGPAAPPVLSARPNEAEQAISRVESSYPESVFPENGTSIDCRSASVARLTCRNIRYELKRIMDERDENEADAPRGQAVAQQWLWRIFNLGFPDGHEDSTNDWGDWSLISDEDARRLAADDPTKRYEFVPYFPRNPLDPVVPDEPK